MNKKELLSEQLDQIKYLFKYKPGRVISEQDSRQGYKAVVNREETTFPETNLQNLFPMGAIDSPQLKTQIESLKPKIEEFIKSSGGKKFNLNITAGESQITNPAGYEEKGSLALARANTVKRYFEQVFADLIKSGSLTITSPENNQQVDIGQTEYKKFSSDPKDKNHKFYLDNKEKYNQEQFVKFTIDGKGVKETTNYICDYSAQAGGGYAKAQDNFLLYPAKTIDVSKLPNGTKIKLTLVTHTVPDLMIVQAGDKKYSTGFVGVSGYEGKMMIVLATILGNAYNGKPPYPFPQDLVPLDTNKAHELFDDEENLKDQIGHVVNINWGKKLSNNVDQIRWYTFQKNPIVSSAPDLKGFTNDGGKSIVITKDDTFSSITYSIYSPIGITAWKFFAECL